MADTNRIAASAQKVVVVNGDSDALGMLESVLSAGRYDMVFVESGERAYSQIRKVQPNLVIVCARIDQVESFQLLSMLKLDENTRTIPVLTYTTEFEEQDLETGRPRPADDEDLAQSHAALRMN